MNAPLLPTSLTRAEEITVLVRMWNERTAKLREASVYAARTRTDKRASPDDRMCAQALVDTLANEVDALARAIDRAKGER